MTYSHELISMIKTKFTSNIHIFGVHNCIKKISIRSDRKINARCDYA